MTSLIPSTRSRLAAVAGSVALALTFAAAPAAMAQDDGPDATILNLLAAIEAKQFDQLPSFFCEGSAEAAFFLDFLSSMLAGLPPGTDASLLLGAIVLDTELESLEVVSQSDTEAVVDFVGSLTLGIDTAALGPFVEAMLAATGVEVTPDMVEMMIPMIVGEFPSETIDLSDQLTLVPGETTPWLICDGPVAAASPSSDPSLEPSPSSSPAA